MNFKHHLTAGAIAILLVAASRFMGGYAADGAQAKKHAAIIAAEIERILDRSTGKSEEGRLVRPDGARLTARLSTHGYGLGTYFNLGETMKLSGQLALSDKRQAHCKDGTMATLRSAENIGGKSGVAVTDFEFSSLSLS